MTIRWLLKTAVLHEKLILDELQSLLPNETILSYSTVLYEVTTSKENIDRLCRYSGLLRVVLFNVRMFPSNLLYNIDSYMDLFSFEKGDRDIEELMNKSSIRSRFIQLEKKDKLLKSPKVEAFIAKHIFQKYTKAVVNLSEPDFTYQVYKIRDSSFSGWIYKKVEFKEVHQRAPVNSPYFGGGALKPHLSRVMVNLLYPHEKIILDPFCGHGGILREIAEIGSTALGFEVKPLLAYQNLENNRFHKFDDFIHLVICDSLKPPLRHKSVNQAISDPPYAIQTTTKGRERDTLVLNWLEIQESGMEVIFSMSTEMLNTVPKDWELLMDRLDYVHRTLTRRVRKMKKI